jgi:alpha-glucosidase
MRLLTIVFLAITTFAGAQQPSTAWRPLGRASAVARQKDGFQVRTSAGEMLRITALADGIIRVQIAPKGTFPVDNSWAVVKEAVEAMRPGALDFRNTAKAVTLKTADGSVAVDKATLAVTFFDAQGKVLSEDDVRRPMLLHEYAVGSDALASSFVDLAAAKRKRATEFKLWKVMPENEHYFGLGDKVGPIDRRNMAFTMWNTDAFGWQESTDPLYKTIPFVVALRNGISYGIFLDNTFRSHFDFGKAERDAWSFGADDGPIDYYFFFGPAPKKVIEEYTALTGRTPLPPRWTLGYQQCRYSYYPEARVREIAKTFAEKQIPVDAIYLDIDYQLKNRPFSVDPQRFPAFTQMIADLKQAGIKTIVITDLHVAAMPGTAPYDSGLAGDDFVKNPDATVYVGQVWPGDSVFPDFTRGPQTRAWWGSLYKEFVADGIKGFWNDMNEPSVFKRSDKTMPLDVVHRVLMPDGSERKADHREIHNVYGMQNARATYEGMLALNPHERPFVLTRAAYAGAQRYAATWTGDNSSSWNHLRLEVPTLLSMGISGYSNVGVDVGGFWGNASAELLTRWLELGAFNPLYRNHTMGTADQEPWVDGPEQEAVRKRYIELRYRLMPYIYTAAEENSRTGVPMMRAMFIEFPEEEMADSSEQFMFGPDLLVAPKIWEFEPSVEVALPKGIWYDFWTSKPIAGWQKVAAKGSLDVLPVYVRGGAVIPEMPLVQNMDQTPQGPLEVRIYPDEQGNCGGSVYWDDGLTFNYQKGEYRRVTFTCTGAPGEISIRSTTEGNFQPWWKEVKFVVLDRKPATEVMVGEQRTNAVYQSQGESITFTVPAESLKEVIQITDH